ncbi:MAG TPA: nucleoside triphosphate pyrophosphatase [Stellaceae bacterium]|jgi:septum formation protein|nr:nucleoside triphosphate pyrophosphatase [Stellaceae bacterium]
MSVLILASASASRQRLLADAGIEAETDPADIDESAIKQECRKSGRSSGDCATRLADAKARAVAQRHRDKLVLGADQMLDCDGEWFDKPLDRAEAREQLQRLRGRTHELVTAATIVRNDEQLWQAIETPRVTMRDFSDSFLDRYLDMVGDRVLKTVGGYELEKLGAQIMEKVEGDHFAILGLPLLPLMHFLRGAGALAA